jgi:hypothetical protein
MRGKVGDTIVCESERAAQPERRGTIEEVLQEDPPRYRVRWDNERESIFSPSSGVARIEAKKKTRAKAKAKA